MVLRALAGIEGTPLVRIEFHHARAGPVELGDLCMGSCAAGADDDHHPAHVAAVAEVIVNARVVVRRVVILGAGDDGVPLCECTEQSGSADREQHVSRDEVGETVEVVVGASIGAEDRVVTKRWRRRRTDPRGRSGGEQFAEARRWRGELEPPCAGDIQGCIVHQRDAIDDGASR